MWNVIRIYWHISLKLRSAIQSICGLAFFGYYKILCFGSCSPNKPSARDFECIGLKNWCELHRTQARIWMFTIRSISMCSVHRLWRDTADGFLNGITLGHSTTTCAPPIRFVHLYFAIISIISSHHSRLLCLILPP